MSKTPRRKIIAVASLLAVVTLAIGYAFSTVSLDFMRANNDSHLGNALEESQSRASSNIAEAATRSNNDAAVGAEDSASSCDKDLSVGAFRQLNAAQWREIHQWQSERGLPLTLMQADGSLRQHTPYPNYDINSLRRMASTQNSEAKYWLAMRYQELNFPTVKLNDGSEMPEDRQLVIQQLLMESAYMGNVQAMLALSAHYYTRLSNSLGEHEKRNTQALHHAWAHVAQWRSGVWAEPKSETPDLAALITQKKEELIQLIRAERARRGWMVLDNQIPIALIELMQKQHANCPDPSIP